MYFGIVLAYWHTMYIEENPQKLELTLFGKHILSETFRSHSVRNGGTDVAQRISKSQFVFFIVVERDPLSQKNILSKFVYWSQLRTSPVCLT